MAAPLLQQAFNLLGNTAFSELNSVITEYLGISLDFISDGSQVVLMDSLVNESGSLAANISEYKVEGARTSLVDHTSTNPYQLSVSFILTNDPNPKYREAVNDIAIGSAPRDIIEHLAGILGVSTGVFGFFASTIQSRMDLLSRWEKEGTMVFYSSALYDTGSEYLISSLSYDRIAETAVNVSLSLRDADIANLQFLTDPNGVEINKSPSNVSKPPIQKGKVVKKNVTDVATNRAISVHNNRTGGPSVIPSSTGTRGRVG